MVKVASFGSLVSASHQIGGDAANSDSMVKRKTPSELRGEQLKTVNTLEFIKESPGPVLGSDGKTDDNDRLKNQNLSKNSNCINTRLDAVYPIKKSRLRLLSVREKENLQIVQPKNLIDCLTLERQQLSRPNDSATTEDSKDDGAQPQRTVEKCSQSIFRSITEISSGGESSSSLADVDMNKALKGLVAQLSAGSGLAADSSRNCGDLLPTCSDFSVPGKRAPLDFTLKTKVTVVFTSPVNWMHRATLSTGYNSMPQLNSQFGRSENSTRLGQTLTSHIVSSEALCSWVYPQSLLPPSVVSMLTSSAADNDFLRKRHQAWEDSFRSLYFMLRRNTCSLFYVCTSHFVAMFTSDSGTGRTKYLCNAYISQSTRGLRLLLREHDVCFSVPLRTSKEEKLNTEDLVELSEIEKQKWGQTRQLNSISDMDNSPQSLLVFHGNKNVQGLYDFLLNYRSILTTLSGVDVPVLCSPIPFQNAAMSAPEIRCAEVKRADMSSLKETELKHVDTGNNTSTSFCSSIEIKDSYIPPWIVSRICTVVGSEGRAFEASFTTELSSIGLNFALKTVQETSRSQTVTGEDLQERSYALGVPETVVCRSCSSGYLKGLKYKDNSYTASIFPL